MKLEKITARGADGLYREATTKIIYFRQFRSGSGEIKISTRTKNLDEAKRFRDHLRQDLARAAAKAKQRKNALELFELWIERKQALRKSPATIASIEASKKHLAPFFTMMMPDEITAVWWESIYIPAIRAQTHEGRRFFNDRKWLTSFLKQLVEDGVIHKLPRLVNPDARVSVGKVYTSEEVELLINFAQNEDLHLAILMAATMGMRRGEIFGLRVDRVNLSSGTIDLRREDTKTRKARSFAISPVTLPLLRARVTAGGKWVFPSKMDPSRPLHKDGFKTAWTNLKRTCGVEGRFHDLRHTFLTRAFSAPNANATLICHYAGLSLEVAERVYLHLTKEDSRKVASLVSYEG